MAPRQKQGLHSIPAAKDPKTSNSSESARIGGALKKNTEQQKELGKLIAHFNGQIESAKRKRQSTEELERNREALQLDLNDLIATAETLKQEQDTVDEKAGLAGRISAPASFAEVASKVKETDRSMDRESSRELRKFLKKKTSILTQVASLYDAEDPRLADKDLTQERVDGLVDKVIAHLPKNLRPGKEDGEGRAAIKAEVVAYALNFRNFYEQLKAKIDVPTTQKGKEALFDEYARQLIVEPDTLIDTQNTFVADLQADLHKNKQVQPLPFYPKGSGKMSWFEGLPIRPLTIAENAAGFVETNAESVGGMMAAKVAAAYALKTAITAGGTPLIYAGTRALAYGFAGAMSFAANIPLKNAIAREIATTQKIGVGTFNALRKNKGKALTLALTVFGVITPAIDSAIKEGLGGQQIGGNVERTLAPAEKAMKDSEGQFNASVHILGEQVAAMRQAEAYPETIPTLMKRFPGMKFGESGHPGPGEKWAAKGLLWQGVVEPNVTVSPDHQRLVAEARKEAGLKEGESITDSLDTLYQEYLANTEARRQEIAQQLIQVHSLLNTVKGQNIASITIGSFFTGDAPTSPTEIGLPSHKLQELLTEQAKAYADMRAEAQRRIDVLTHASEELLPGSSLSISLPKFSLLEQFKDFFDVELTSEHPLITQFENAITSVMHPKEIEGLSGKALEAKFKQLGAEYKPIAETMVKSIGITTSILLTFLVLGFRIPAAVGRGKALKEQQSFHVAEAREAEEETIDLFHKHINETINSMIPGAPEVTRLRVRLALREFIASKVVELPGATDGGERVKHWLLTNFWEHGQVPEDSAALAGFKHILEKIRTDTGDAGYVNQFLNVLFPGFTGLDKKLGHDIKLLQAVTRGEQLSEKDAEQLRGKFRNVEAFLTSVNRDRLEMTYQSLARELRDTDLEYESLSNILANIKEGADTYKVFTATSEMSSLERRGAAEAFNLKGYEYSLEKKKLRKPEVSESDQRLMRRVAEDTQASKVIIKMMGENRLRRQSVADELEKMNQVFATAQLEKGVSKQIAIPAATLEGAEVKALRDQLAASTGVFEDIASQVKENLYDIPRQDAGAKEAEYPVSSQLDAMATEFLKSSTYEEFLFALNDGRTPNEKLHIAIRPVYGTKMDRASDYPVDVPGFSLRLAVLDTKGKEVGFEDFQMSHVLLTNKTPADSARAFVTGNRNWAVGATSRLEGKFRREWLTEHFVDGDKNRLKEAVFSVPPDPGRAKAWLDNFYTKVVLSWKRAEKARELVKKQGQITQQDLKVFLENDPSYDAVPPRSQVEATLARYYENIKSRGALDTPRAAMARLGGMTMNLWKWQITKSSQNRKKEPMAISDYR